MNTITHFTDLEAWKVSHEICLHVYQLTKNFPSSEKFGIIDQLRRASSSVTVNIAEGWGRYHFADRTKFYYQARGSNTEVENFLILSKDLGYISITEFDSMLLLVKRGFQIISGLIRSIEERGAGSR